MESVEGGQGEPLTVELGKSGLDLAPTSADAWRLNLGIAEHSSLEKKGCRYGVWKEWDQDHTDGRLVAYASRRTRHDFRRGRRGSSFGVCQAWGFCRVVLLSPALGRPRWYSTQAVFYYLCSSQRGRAHHEP